MKIIYKTCKLKIVDYLITNSIIRKPIGLYNDLYSRQITTSSIEELKLKSHLIITPIYEKDSEDHQILEKEN